MTTLYKLTTQDNKTRPGEANECVWGPGVTHSGTGEGGLCGPGWIHAYADPLLAVLLNAHHADYPDPKLWEAEGEVAKNDYGLKVGCRSLTTIREIPLPRVTPEQTVRFAILCVLEISITPQFTQWAIEWLSGKDRSAGTAEAVRVEMEDLRTEMWRNVTRATTNKEEAWAAEAACGAAAAAATTQRGRVILSVCMAQAAKAAVAVKKESGGDLDIIALAQKAMDSDAG